MRRQIRERLIVRILLSFLCLLGPPWTTRGKAQRQTSLPPNIAIHVRLNDQLDTIKTKAKDIFSATLTRPVVIDNRTVFPRGAKAIGRVRKVASSTGQRPASITLELTEVGGVSIRTSSLRIRGKTHPLQDMRLIGANEKTGLPVTGVAWVEGGTFGFGFGSPSGRSTHYLTDDNEIVVPAETVLMFNSLGNKPTRK